MALGCVVGTTADHGMNDKALPDGSPHVIFLEDVLNRQFGAGAVRVICPITDPFVRHHGALGSFVRVYRQERSGAGRPGAGGARACPASTRCWSARRPRPNTSCPLTARPTSSSPATANTVIGASAAEHDLSDLAGHRLRSHGGRGEQRVPFLLSHPLNAEYRAMAQSKRLRNFDIFDFALNGVET